MRKSSTITAREQPLIGAASRSGVMKAHGETFTVETTQRVELIDLTDRLRTIVKTLPVQDGLLNLFSTHTTCAVFINEFQTALLADIRTFLERVVGQHESWLHNNPAHSDCDRMNADAHLRAMLLGQSLTLQLSGGDVTLGQWQRVLMAELDGPRVRTLRLQVLGIG